MCYGYLITYWQFKASVEVNWTSGTNFIMPCNRLNQSKSWVLNAFLSWDLHNWHINMHEINWKWQKEVGKMFTSVQIKAFAKRAPEHKCLLGGGHTWHTWKQTGWQLASPRHSQCVVSDAGTWGQLFACGWIHLSTLLILALIYNAISERLQADGYTCDWPPGRPRHRPQNSNHNKGCLQRLGEEKERGAPIELFLLEGSRKESHN